MGCLLVLVNELILRTVGHEVEGDRGSVARAPEPLGHVRSRGRLHIHTAGRHDTNGSFPHRLGSQRRMSRRSSRPRGVRMTWCSPMGKSRSFVSRGYALGPIAYSRAVEHPWAAMMVLIPALFVATFGFLTVVMHRAIVVRPRRHRRLYTHGTAVAGVVTDRRFARTKYGTFYYINYSFTAADGSSPRSARDERAEHQGLRRRSAGAGRAVLHDPADPTRSTIYDYGGFRCV